MDPSMLLYGVLGVGGVILVVKPQLFGMWFVRLTGWAGLLERRAMQGKAAYAAVKDAKKEQLRKRYSEMMNQLAGIRGQFNIHKNKMAGYQKEEDELNATKETILQKMTPLQEGTPEYANWENKYTVVTSRLQEIDAEQAKLETMMAELSASMEEVKPDLKDLETQIGNTEASKQMGLMEHDLAQIRKDRARRRGLMTAGKQTYVDRAEQLADEELQKEIAAGQIAQEQAGSTASEVARSLREDTAVLKAQSSLKEELTKRRGTAVPPTAGPERLTKG